MGSAPKLSIIITCYNRREYLSKAIDSAINQDIRREEYEIILIKNFLDEEIDLKCKRLGIKNIVIPGTIGEYMHRAITEAKGDVISFLDDDDEFVANKVSTVIRLYESKKFNFLHNDFIEIDQDGNTHKSIRKELHMTNSTDHDLYISKNVDEKIYNELLRADADFNISCISISSLFASKIANYATEITASTDSFLYYMALNNGGVLVINDVLTKYRLHESTSNTASTLVEFVKNMEKESLRQIKSLEKIAAYLTDPFVKKSLNDEIIVRKLKLFALCGKKKYDDVQPVQILKVRDLADFHLKFFLIWSTIYILSKLFGQILAKLVFSYILFQQGKT